MAKTTAEQAKDIALKVTNATEKGLNKSEGSLWSDNPVQWWSNIMSNANTADTFFNNLTDLIISVRTRALDFDSPIKNFKSGDMPLGFGSTEIYINPQSGRYFAINPEETTTGNVYYPGVSYSDGVIVNGIGANQLSVTTTVKDGYDQVNAAVNTNKHILLDKLPDVKQIFFRVNYGRQYQRTYSSDALTKLVPTWDAFGEFIDDVSRDINASKNIDEYNNFRALFTDAINYGLIPIYPLTALATESDAKTMLQYARMYHTNFKFPSENYSLWNGMNPANPIKTWCKDDDINIILTSETSAVVDVQALSAAFNLEYAKFTGKQTTVDFLDNDRKVKAIMFDAHVIHWENVLDQSGEFYNPAGVKLNLFRNVQASMALNPFANIVAFTTNTFTLVSEEPADWTTAVGKYYTKNEAGLYIGIKGADETFVADTFYVIG